MNPDEEEKIYCARCGEPMKRNARYCMKCGNLNYEHEANKKIKRYIPKPKDSAYQVGSGEFLFSDPGKNNVKLSVATNTGNIILAFIVNYCAFLLSIFGALIISCKEAISLNEIINSNFPFLSLFITIIFIFIYSLELVYMKCNKKWWSALVPIYNFMVLSEIVFNKKIYGLIVCVPVIGEMFLLFMLYKLGNSFKYSGLLVALFFIIYCPIIGFGPSSYKGYVFASSTDNAVIERDYKLKKIFLYTSLFIFVIGVVLSVYSKMNNEGSDFNSIGNYYYVYATNKIVKKVKKEINNKNISCRDMEYKNNEGVYYVYLYDVIDYVHLPLYLLREPISAYVKIDNTGGSSKYYVSMSDGKMGYPETYYEEIKQNKIIEYKELDKSIISYNLCDID